jgi:PmbA protein
LTEDQLESAAEMAVFDAEKLGAREAEAYASSIRSLRAVIVDGHLYYSSIFNEVGVGIRIVEDGATGFSFTNSLTKKDIRDAVERAFHLCKSSKPDFPPATLPKSLGKNQIGDSYDPRIAKINVESVINLAKEIVDGINEVDKKHELSATGSVKSVELIRAVDTSGAGIVTESVTMLEGLAKATLRSDSLTTWTEWNGVRVGSLDGASEGSTAAENCLSLKKQMSENEHPSLLVLDRQAFASIMSVAWRVFDASWGDRFQMGQQVGEPFLSIYDNELAPNGISSRGFDDEGLKTSVVHLVQSGIVSSYLTNYRWAQKLKINPTASAFRYGDRPFTSAPDIGPTNISISGDGQKLDEMLRSAKGGVHVVDARNVRLIGKTLTFSAFPAYAISSSGEDSTALRPLDLAMPVETFFRGIAGVESGKKEYPGVSASAVLLKPLNAP